MQSIELTSQRRLIGHHELSSNYQLKIDNLDKDIKNWIDQNYDQIIISALDTPHEEKINEWAEKGKKEFELSIAAEVEELKSVNKTPGIYCYERF